VTRDGEERLVDRSSGNDSWHRRVLRCVRDGRFALRRMPVLLQWRDYLVASKDSNG
jgi:hypothetical protein